MIQCEMRRLILIGWILFLKSSCSNSDKTDQHLAISEKYPVNSLHEDYEQLIRVLKKNHPAMYDFTTKNEYERLIKLQDESITDSLTISGFYNILSPLVTEIGCGHSRVHLPNWVWKDSTVTLLPLDLFFQNNKGYVIENYSSNNGLRAGTEILSINGQDIPSVLNQIKKLISTDGNNISAKREVLNQFFNQLLASYSCFPRKYEIGFRLSENESIQKMNISSIRAQSYFDAQSKPDSLLQFEIDSLKRTAIITIKSFGFYDKLEEFKAFVDSTFSQIEHAKIDNIILDLRNNGGGDPICASYLMTYLVNKPVTYFSEPYQTYTELAKPQPLPINHFTGKLYTLINGICFSTTGHLCALLKYHKVGEFIGTETGGTYTCNDDSQTFRLINTGILVRVARSTFTVAVEKIPRFKGIIPDYIIEPSLQDILTGKDCIKDFAQMRIAMSLNN
jgi:hypothetical protein